LEGRRKIPRGDIRGKSIVEGENTLNHAARASGSA
jgi:hypothetical protein